MGDFFNTKIMGLKRIPKSGKMEQMRKEYNESHPTPTTESLVDPVEIMPRRKRRVRDENGNLPRRKGGE